MNKVEQAVRILDDWVGSGLFPVDPEQAKIRANICLKCPHHGNLFWLTRSFIRAVRMAMAVKKSMRVHIEEEKLLKGCLVCGCDLRLKVHVPLKHILASLPAKQEEEFRSVKCWITRENDISDEL